MYMYMYVYMYAHVCTFTIISLFILQLFHLYYSLYVYISTWMHLICLNLMCFSGVEGETPPENPHMIPSRKADLLVPVAGMHEALFLSNNSNNRLVNEVVT